MSASNTKSHQVQHDFASTAGTLLADKLQSTMAYIFGEDSITLADIDNYRNLCFKVEKVQLLEKFGRRQGYIGTLYPTTTHLIFTVPNNEKDADSRVPLLEIWVPNSHIGYVERGPLSVSGCPLTLKCKTFRTASFIVPRDKECQMLYETLILMSQPINMEDLCAFHFVAPSSWNMSQCDGWNKTHVLDDYKRMGLPNQAWALNDFNLGYQYCDTYPQSLFLPTAAPKQVLIGSSKFRSRGRLPALSYWYQKTGACLCRCSQPLVGFSARCVEDEALMQYIRRANTNDCHLYIVDTRPKVNAMVNKASGKGFEDEKNYADMRFHFCNIENIHVMRSSLNKMIDLCSQPASLTATQFLQGLEGCAWLKHIRSVLECSAFIKDALLRGHSCVVHCSDGWDRTAQTVTLAQILIDPFYRTIQGLKVLIEREWLSFGHKFSDRCGHTAYPAGSSEIEKTTGNINSTSSKEISPIFLQLLECIFQLSQMHPLSFEYNERFLLELHDHVHSCQFGTFLGNCDKDRLDLRLNERTYSFWAYLDNNMHRFINSIYQPNTSPGPLNCDLKPQRLRFWSTMYNRFDDGLLPRESLLESANIAHSHLQVLLGYKNVLQKKVSDLRLVKVRSSSAQSVMVDSGHSSAGNTSDKHISHAQSDNESGFEDSCNSEAIANRTKLNSSTNCDGLSSSVMSMSMDGSYLDEEPQALQVKWQPTRNANNCSACHKTLHLHDFKGHCVRCGLLFCEKCLRRESNPPPALPVLQYSGCAECVKVLSTV